MIMNSMTSPTLYLGVYVTTSPTTLIHLVDPLHTLGPKVINSENNSHYVLFESLDNLDCMDVSLRAVCGMSPISSK